MTAWDIIEAAGEELQDRARVRWTETHLIRLINQAQDRVRMIRPDLLLDDDGSMRTLEPATTRYSTLAFGPEVKRAMIYLVSSIALGEEGSSQANLARSVQYRQLAEHELTSGG